MKIMVWGINYAPELTGIAPYNTALCENLRSRGHEVAMLTTFPYYPEWRKRAEDRGCIYRADVINGVPVHRCWHYVPEKVSAMKRIVHEGSFVATSFARLVWMTFMRGGRPDVLVVVSPPLALGAAAWCFRLLTRVTSAQVPFIFHVQDLQPDAALGLGMLKEGPLTRALYRLESLAYSAAARVSGISHGMLEAFARKGVPPEKRVYFPNPVVLPDLSRDLPAPGGFRRRNGFADSDFLAIYSGNLGVKQGLSILLEAAQILSRPAAGHANSTARTEVLGAAIPGSTPCPSWRPIRVVICGDGAERENLAEHARARRLEQIVTLLPLQPREQYEEMLVDSDVCLITQQAGSGKAFFPSKLLTTLAFARPVLTVADADSELARALDDGQFGINVSPGDPGQLARALRVLAADRNALSGMAERGRAYVEQFAADKVFNQFERELQRAVS